MNTYRLPDGRIFRVVGSNILVERIPLQQVSPGGIIIRREKEDATAIGIIRAVGHIHTKKGNEVNIRDVEPGMKCAFLWFYAERHTNQQIQARIGENLILLKWEDISLVWDPKVHDYEISDIVSLGA